MFFRVTGLLLRSSPRLFSKSLAVPQFSFFPPPSRLLSGNWKYGTDKLLSIWTSAETPLLHWSGLSDAHLDHGYQRDQSLRRTRLNGDGEWRAHHHAKRQTQNLGGESAEDEKGDTRKRNMGWEIWLSPLLCRIRNRTRKCLEISLLMWKKRWR